MCQDTLGVMPTGCGCVVIVTRPGEQLAYILPFLPITDFVPGTALRLVPDKEQSDATSRS